jgi:HPt (histidine-containing phosphotransfer) domain-containing protein
LPVFFNIFYGSKMTEKTLSDKNIFNDIELLDRLCGSRENFLEILEEIPRRLQPEMEQLETFIREKKVDRISGKAHGIKGVLINSAASRASEAARKLEIASQNEAPDRLQPYLKDLQREIDILYNTLQIYAKTWKI